MIKATSMGPLGNVNAVFLGLSDENWTRLRAGAPIPVALRELNEQLPDVTVVLLGGETEDSLMDDLRSLGPIGQQRDERPGGGS